MWRHTLVLIHIANFGIALNEHQEITFPSSFSVSGTLRLADYFAHCESPMRSSPDHTRIRIDLPVRAEYLGVLLRSPSRSRIGSTLPYTLVTHVPVFLPPCRLCLEFHYVTLKITYALQNTGWSYTQSCRSVRRCAAPADTSRIWTPGRCRCSTPLENTCIATQVPTTIKLYT